MGEPMKIFRVRIGSEVILARENPAKWSKGIHLKEGALSKYGWKASLPAALRHMALDKCSRAEGRTKCLRRVLFISNIGAKHDMVAKMAAAQDVRWMSGRGPRENPRLPEWLIRSGHGTYRGVRYAYGMPRNVNAVATRLARTLIKRRFGPSWSADVEFDMNGDAFLYAWDVSLPSDEREDTPGASAHASMPWAIRGYAQGPRGARVIDVPGVLRVTRRLVARARKSE